MSNYFDLINKNSKQKKFEMPNAKILLKRTQYDFDLFFEHFKKRWRYFEVSPYRDKNTFGIITDGMVIGCAFTPAPVSDPVLIQSAKDSVLWPHAEVHIANHNAHVTVSLVCEKDPISTHVLFSKVIYSMLHQKSAIGVYLNPGLLESAYYIKCCESLFSRKLPTELWVHINCIDLEKDQGFSFYTLGMKKFGKKEFEMLETTKKNFIDAYYFFKNIVRNTIENNIVFKDGDFLGNDADKISLSVSKGVNLNESTIKINT